MAQTILQLEFEGKKMPVVIGSFDKIERVAKLALAELIEKIFGRELMALFIQVQALRQGNQGIDA